MNERVYLRALDIGDAERVHRWHNDSSLYELLGGTHRYVSRQAALTWLEQTISYSAQSSGDVKLAICVRESNQHIGNIYLLQPNWVARNARMEVFIGDPAERHKGYGESAVRQLLIYAFTELGLKRIYLTVLKDNPAAIRCYEKIGFVREGQFRNHVFKGGRWIDVIAMAICAEEPSFRAG